MLAAEMNYIPLYADNKDKFWLSWDMECALLLREACETDLLAFLITVFLDI